MSLQQDLKTIFKQSGQSVRSVNELLNQKHGTDFSEQNLHKKINNETIRYTEVVDILDSIGYDIIWQKRTER